MKYKDLYDRNKFSEQEYGKFILRSFAAFEKEIDLLVAYHYSEKENLAVENWQYDLYAHQMRL